MYLSPFERLKSFNWRPLAFPSILFLLSVGLFLSNRTTVTALQNTTTATTENSVILGLYQAGNFLYVTSSSLISPAFYPYLLLFIGMAGIFQLLTSLKLYTNRYLPFIGAVFYALNIGTFWFFTYISLPLMFLFALLPWQLWIFFHILKGSSLSRGRKLLAFFLIQLATAPAFTYPGSFTFLLALVALLCLGILFSRSFFRVMSHGPAVALLIVLLNLYWFLPRLYLLIDNNKTVIAFKDAINQSLMVITAPQFLLYVQRQPGIIIGVQFLFAGIIILGILKLSRYHVPFLLTTLVLSFPFWLKLPYDIPELKQFFASIALPGVLFILIAGTFFFVQGLAMILAIYTFLQNHYHKRRPAHHHNPTHSVMKSPFEMYQELLTQTQNEHGSKQFTPLQFTEHMLRHLIGVKTANTTHTEHRKHLEVRYLCYAAFLLIIISGVTAFQGKYFPATTTAASKTMNDRLAKTLETLSPEKRAIMSQYTGELDQALASEDERAVQQIYDKYGLQKEQPVQLFQTLPNIGPSADSLRADHVFARHGNYYTSDASLFDIYYPFRVIEGKDFYADGKNTVIKQEVQQNLMKRLGDYDIESATEAAEISIVSSNGQTSTFETSPYVEMNGDKMTMNFESRPLEVIKPDQFTQTICADNPDDACFTFNHKGLEHQYGYLITVTSTTKNPDILPFSIEDLKHTHTYFEGNISAAEENIVLPPAFVHGVGYSFIMKSVNYRDWTIHVSYLPYDEIQDVRFVGRTGVPLGKTAPAVPVKKISSTQYEVQIPQLAKPNTMTLGLYQDSDDGWKAYKVDPSRVHNVLDIFFLRLYPFGYVKELGTHSTLNTWANAWKLDKEWSNSTVLLLFWPQYLEYAGLAVVAALGIIFIFIRLSERLRK